MLALQYIGVMASLILLLCRTYGVETINLFVVTIPVVFSFTVVPAITLPMLFFFESRGRTELLFVYVLLFPFWCPLTLAAANIEGVIDIGYGVVFMTMYLAFAVNCLAAVVGVCMAGNDMDEGVPLLAFAFGFGIPISLPTFLVMPIVISETFDPESDVTALFQDVFSPLYIDIIILCAFSLLSICIKELQIKKVSKLIREIAKAANPVYICSEHC